MAATITVRRLINGDPSYGSGQADFLTDLQAVAQIIGTRLKLLQGEWWADLTQGFPLFQSMLGQSGSGKHQQAILLVIQQSILASPYVSSISDITSSFNGSTRFFAFSCKVQTQFGSLTVTNYPGANAVIS